MMADTPYHWRDDVTIGTGFTPDQRMLLERSLNQIAAAFDGDGKQLLQRAHQLQGSPVILEPGEHGSQFDPRYNILNVDFFQLSVTTYKDLDRQSAAGGSSSYASVTGMLVHELFHAADPRMLDNYMLRQTRAALAPLAQAAGLTEKEIDQGSEELFMWLYKHEAPKPILVSKIESAIPNDALVAALKNKGVVAKDGSSITIEADAVDYTDQFMWKNFGFGEPQRQFYMNNDLTSASPTPASPKPLPVPYPQDGFAVDPSALGALPKPPEVTPTNTDHYPIKTARDR